MVLTLEHVVRLAMQAFNKSEHSLLFEKPARVTRRNLVHPKPYACQSMLSHKLVPHLHFGAPDPPIMLQRVIQSFLVPAPLLHLIYENDPAAHKPS